MWLWTLAGCIPCGDGEILGADGGCYGIVGVAERDLDTGADTDAEDTGDDSGDTDDTGDGGGPPWGSATIVRAEGACVDEGWGYEIETDGEAERSELLISGVSDDGAPRDERHEPGVLETSEERTVFRQLLPYMPEVPFVPDVNTHFSCEAQETMTWMATVWTAGSDERSDCVVWGADPRVFAEHGCRPIDGPPDGG